VSDGALGFWAAVRDVWPKIREQRALKAELLDAKDRAARLLGTCASTRSMTTAVADGGVP
jgi:hypothetical protein